MHGTRSVHLPKMQPSPLQSVLELQLLDRVVVQKLNDVPGLTHHELLLHVLPYVHVSPLAQLGEHESFSHFMLYAEHV